MKTELDVLDTLCKFLNDNLDIPAVVDYPDTDNMKSSTMIYIEPEDAEYQPLTISSDLAILHATIYIIAKKDTPTNLLQKVFRHSDEVFTLIRQNQTLNGFVEFSNITAMEYYPAVEANKNIKAIELSLDLQWTKDW